MTDHRIDVVVFDGFEELDAFGPVQVFGTASRLHAGEVGSDLFDCRLVASEPGLVVGRYGTEVLVAAGFTGRPGRAAVVVPGGVVSHAAADPKLLRWLGDAQDSGTIVTSVCNGALVLAAAGLLAGRRVTTHWEDVELLRAAAPDAEVVEEERFVDDGALVTSAGVTAGIDMSLHLVARLAGTHLATRTALQLEHHWKPG